MTAKAPIPSRCDVREIGAMNVYSMVPSHRSQATVSVTISKISPRYDQITAPIRSTMVVRLTSRWPPPASIPLAMNTIVSVFATVYRNQASSHQANRADQVDVALDDAGEADQLTSQRASLLRADHAGTPLRLSSSSSSNERPVAFRNACSSVSAW